MSSASGSGPSGRGRSGSEHRILALLKGGDAHREQGRYRQAEHCLQRALRGAVQLFGDRSAQATAVRNSLGVLFKYTGRFPEAAALYRRALRDTMALVGPDHPEVASLYHNLGGLEHARRRFARGELLARKGIAIRRKVLGVGHPEVAADAAALGAILAERGKLDEAERLYRGALRVWGTRRSHRYDIAVTLNNLGALNYKRGNLGIAARDYRRAIVIKRKLFGSKNVDVAITLYNLGMLEDAREEQRSAQPLFLQALKIFEATLPARHPSRVLAAEAAARLIGRQGYMRRGVDLMSA